MQELIKVLLIEDNRVEARQTQQWLGEANDGFFEVTWVEQLKQGLERIAAGGIDIVLLDLNLPDSQGLETFVKLHDQEPDIPIVVLTGEYDEAIGTSAIEKGAQDYLIKTQANSASLAHVLHYALGRHRAHLEQLATERRRQQAEMAREVQLRMLPQFRPEVPGYDFQDYYKAAGHVGGDYFSYWKLPDQRIAISIADVCGKGISAALTMAELCSEVRHCLETTLSADIMVSRLNRHFCERNSFITFTLCILDQFEHTLTVVNAGHMPPLRRAMASECVESLPLLSCGLPLGVQPDEVYAVEVFDIKPGDLFLMCTDGITEMFGASKELYGQQNLVELLRRAPANVEQTVQSLIHDVETFRGSKTQSDDMCVVSFARRENVKLETPQATRRVVPRELLDVPDRISSGSVESKWTSEVTSRARAKDSAKAC